MVIPSESVDSLVARIEETRAKLVEDFAETIAAWVECEHLSHDGMNERPGDWRCMGCGQVERHTKALYGEIHTKDGRFHAEVIHDADPRVCAQNVVGASAPLAALLDRLEELNTENERQAWLPDDFRHFLERERDEARALVDELRHAIAEIGVKATTLDRPDSLLGWIQVRAAEVLGENPRSVLAAARTRGDEELKPNG